ncbi:MAG: protein kinase [Myxococcota bacterium]
MAVVLRLLLLVVAFLGAAFVFVPGIRPDLVGPQLADELSNHATLGLFLGKDSVMTPAAGGLFVLLGVAALVSFGWGGSRRRRDPLSLAPGQKPTKKIANQLLEAKRYKEAEEMFRHLGIIDGLVAALKGQAKYVEAAELLESDARHSQAAEILEDSNQAPAMQRAGELWQALGNAERGLAVMRKAAALFAAKGEGDKAIEALAKYGDTQTARQYLDSAAEALARQGKHARAAEMFEKFGDEARAAAAYEYDASTQTEERDRKQSGVKAAKLYRKVGDMVGCGRALEISGFHEKAAEAYGMAKDWASAARCLNACGQTERAAQLLVQSGMGHQAVAVLENTGDMRAAAAAALASHDFYKAAQIYEDMGDLEAAFNAHVQGANYPAAAEIALQRNRPQDAADLFERAGNPRRAAEIYEAMGNRLKAGELYGRAGDKGGAARMLVAENRIKEAAQILLGDSRPESLDVQQEVARRLMMGGELKGAITLLKSGVDARAPNECISATLELSNMLEAAGDIPSALAYAQRALAAKKDHAEAVMRVQQLFMRINNEQMRAAYETAMAQQQAALVALNMQKPLTQPEEDKPPRYVPEAEIGRGAMGLVFRARDTVLNRMVALKRLPEVVASDPEARQRFLEEARAAAGLNHPSVVTVYDAGVEKGLPYLAMELIDGTTLSHLQQQGVLTPSKALSMCAAVASALDHAHKAGIVHRDVKPGNILISKEGRVKLTDFGIAAAFTSGEAKGVTGTPYYMSPEQVRGAAVDGRADIYSLGCVLYALLTGKPPFTGSDVMQAHLRAPVPSLAVHKPDLPAAELDAVIARCMAKDPAQRFATAQECGRAFLELEARLRKQAGA